MTRQHLLDEASNGSLSVTLQAANQQDLCVFYEMEQADDTKAFIAGDTLAEHQRAFYEADTRYLKILSDKRVAGFILLVIEPANTVELRRVVIQPGARGIGQFALRIMEVYCQAQFNTQRIWLDVLPGNHRARRVYEKLGYRRFFPAGAQTEWLFYQKCLTNPTSVDVNGTR